MAYNEIVLQSLYSISFMPNGDWFIFENLTGKTAFAGFQSKRSALMFLLNNQGEFLK